MGEQHKRLGPSKSFKPQKYPSTKEHSDLLKSKKVGQHVHSRTMTANEIGAGISSKENVQEVKVLQVKAKEAKSRFDCVFPRTTLQ